MRVAKREQPWVEHVRRGDLKAAGEHFAARGRSRRLSDNQLSKILTAHVGPFLIRRLSKKFDFVADDTGIDLSDEFFLFFKQLDYVGPRLLKKIIMHALIHRRLQVRATLWFGHWLVYQGRYAQAAAVLRLAMHRLPSEKIRLRGEFLALFANYHFLRGHIDRADRLHQKAQLALNLAGDKFFQMFNLGQWVKISAQKDDSSHLNRILSAIRWRY